jgi:hypothetical protein
LPKGNQTRRQLLSALRGLGWKPVEAGRALGASEVLSKPPHRDVSSTDERRKIFLALLDAKEIHHRARFVTFEKGYDAVWDEYVAGKGVPDKDKKAARWLWFGTMRGPDVWIQHHPREILDHYKRRAEKERS